MNWWSSRSTDAWSITTMATSDKALQTTTQLPSGVLSRLPCRAVVQQGRQAPPGSQDFPQYVRHPRVQGAGAAVGCQERQAHTGDMGRVIGTILGAILAIWLVVTVAGEIFATLKTFVIIGLIAMAVFIVVWLVARRPSGG